MLERMVEQVLADQKRQEAERTQKIKDAILSMTSKGSDCLVLGLDDDEAEPIIEWATTLGLFVEGNGEMRVFKPGAGTTRHDTL